MDTHRYQEVGGQCAGECRLCGNVREAPIHSALPSLLGADKADFDHGFNDFND